MTAHIYERSLLVFGETGLKKLQSSHVLIVGIGGVGGFAAEAVARAGVGRITLVDHDTVSASNLNRQIIATIDVIGDKKVDVMKKRIQQINPLCQIETIAKFLTTEDMLKLLEQGYDYVIDAIDSLNCKVELVKTARDLNLPIISSMGAGRRYDPSKIEISTLNKTNNCGLAREMRQRLKKIGYGKCIDVVFSSEFPLKAGPIEEIKGYRNRVVNGTASYMPAIFGLMIAGVVITNLSQIDS